MRIDLPHCAILGNAQTKLRRCALLHTKRIGRL
jgi:hypothetical protein